MQTPKIDITATKVLHQWKSDSPLIACRIAPNGQQAATTSEDSNVTLWKVTTGDKTTLKGHESWPHALAYSPDGSTLVTGGCDGKLIWWSAGDSEPKAIRTVDAHPGWIRAVDISTDGKLLLSTGNDRALRIWDMNTGNKLHEWSNAHDRHIYSAFFLGDSKGFVSGDLLGKIHLWNLDVAEKLRTLEATPLYSENKGQKAEFGGVRCMAFSPQRGELLAGGTHKASNPFGAVHEPLVLRLNWEDGAVKKPHACEGIPGGMIWRVQWLSDGTALGVSGGSSGGFLLFFQDSQEKEIHRFKLPSLARDMDLHPSGLIATAHYDRHLRIVSISA
jgi:WD40 repeat protein